MDTLCNGATDIYEKYSVPNNLCENGALKVIMDPFPTYQANLIAYSILYYVTLGLVMLEALLSLWKNDLSKRIQTWYDFEILLVVLLILTCLLMLAGYGFLYWRSFAPIQNAYNPDLVSVVPMFNVRIISHGQVILSDGTNLTVLSAVRNPGNELVASPPIQSVCDSVTYTMAKAVIELLVMWFCFLVRDICKTLPDTWVRFCMPAFGNPMNLVK
jgi:hypothetical protein